MTESDDVQVSELFTIHWVVNSGPFPTVSPIYADCLLPPQNATISREARETHFYVVLFLYRRLFSLQTFLEMHCLPCLPGENIFAPDYETLK